MLKITGFICVALCLPSMALADHSHGRPLRTDRPDAAEASEVTEKRHFQVETSFEFSHDENNGITTKTISFPTLFRFGILKNLELRLESETYAIQTMTGAPKENGFTDLAAGFKIHLIENKGLIPSFGFLGHLSIPTGKSPFSSKVAEPIFKTLADWELPLEFSLGTNWGIDVPARDAAGDRFARFLYAVALGHPMPFLKERFGFFIEFAGGIPIQSIQSDEHSFDTGLTFIITPRTQIDSFVSIGMNNATTDISTGLGFSWRIL